MNRTTTQFVVSLLLVLSLCGCGRNAPAHNDAKAQHGVTSAATAELPADELQQLGGDPCSGDCSGHDAGYDWAERKGIVDPNDCGGSDSFVEGCMAYAEEQRQDRDTQQE